MTQPTLVEELKEFVTQVLLHGDARGLEPTTNLIETGILNSTGLVKLVRFILERYAIRVPFKEITPDNVRDLERIADLIARLRSG